MSLETLRAPADTVLDTDARWLARLTLPEPPRGLAELPEPQLVSARLDSDSALREHVYWWMRNPEPGGDFEVATRAWRSLPDDAFARLLLARGYDGLFYARSGVVLGHVFYARHGADWHTFAAAVGDDWRGRGYSTVMVLDYLAHASRAGGVTRARVGRGRNDLTRRVLTVIRAHEERLGWRVADDGWVTFSR